MRICTYDDVHVHICTTVLLGKYTVSTVAVGIHKRHTGTTEKNVTRSTEAAEVVHRYPTTAGVSVDFGVLFPYLLALGVIVVLLRHYARSRRGAVVA